MRSMIASLSQSIDKVSDKKISQIDKEEQENKFIDNMRPMTDSLLQSIDKVSEIDKRISQVNKKEQENKFIDNMRSMTTLLSQSIDNVSNIDKKISQIDKKGQENKLLLELIKKFPNTYKFCNGDHNKFALLLKKAFILINTWIAGKN